MACTFCGTQGAKWTYADNRCDRTCLIKRVQSLNNTDRDTGFKDGCRLYMTPDSQVYAWDFDMQRLIHVNGADQSGGTATAVLDVQNLPDMAYANSGVLYRTPTNHVYVINYQRTGWINLNPDQRITSISVNGVRVQPDSLGNVDIRI